MVVPKGKTIYIGKKKLNAGDKIPVLLEPKFSKILEEDKKKKSNTPPSPPNNEGSDK